jgi:hypothetical protein
MLRVTPLIILFLIVQVSFAQMPKQKIADSISAVMEELRNKNRLIDNKNILTLDPEVTLELLKPYERDISPLIRDHAFTLAWQIARSNPSLKIRQEVTTRLVEGLRDIDPLVWQQSSKYLLDFHSEDFTGATKTAINQLLDEKKLRQEIVRIAGVANMQGEMDRLGKLLIDESTFERGLYTGKWYGTVGWAARLARARMGNKADISHAIGIVESEPDDVTRVTILLHDIAYIRQPEAIEVLQQYLESDKLLPQIEETVPGVPYQQYAMDILTEIIFNFPVNNKCVGCYRKDEIKLAREWMRSQKEFKIKR